MFAKLEVIASSSTQRERFARAANNLLNHCFILKKKDDTKQDYIYIKDNKEEFTNLFKMLGYEITIDEDIGLISIKNPNGTGRLQFTKFESIMFLIVKLLYLEKRNDISSSGDNIFVTVQDIRDKYAVLKIKNKQRLDKRSEMQIFSLLKRYNLIRSITPDLTDGETKIEIYPSIMLAVPNEGINHLYENVKQRLQEFQDEDEVEQDETIDEETE